MERLQDTLLSLQDIGYREMLLRIIPNIESKKIFGVRTPELRRLAKEMAAEEALAFKQELPHMYFEENQIHSFLLERNRNFELTVSEVNKFLPYVDNWATCDQLNPKVFKKHKSELLPHIRQWVCSDSVYTIRFGIRMLMSHYLDEDFSPEYLVLVASVHHQDYYVKMMIAWYFATALAKQFDTVLPYISEYPLEKWTHNKAIQKAVESYRITPEQKMILKQYHIK